MPQSSWQHATLPVDLHLFVYGTLSIQWLVSHPDNSCLLQVGDLREKKISVHVSVTGTPLIMQLTKVLLPGLPRNLPAAETLAHPLAGLQLRGKIALGGSRQAANEGLPAGMALPFGQLLADTPAKRCFYVFNTASLPVQVDWTFYRFDFSGLFLCGFNGCRLLYCRQLFCCSLKLDMLPSLLSVAVCSHACLGCTFL